MAGSVRLPKGVERYRFQGGCGEHAENGLMLLNERRCEDGEWIRFSDLPAILVAERKRFEEFQKAVEFEVGCMEHYGEAKPGVLGKLAREMAEPIRAALTKLEEAGTNA